MIALKQLDLDELPEGSEEATESDESDDECADDELDLAKPRQFGKQSTRARTQTKLFGYMIDSTRIEIDQDEPAASAATAASK